MKSKSCVVFVLVLVLTTTWAIGIDGRDKRNFRRREQTDVFTLPDGLWSSRGYGMTFNVTSGNIEHMEETAISCVTNPFILEFIDPNPQVSGNTAVITAEAATINRFVLDRTEDFTLGCSGGMRTPVLGDSNYDRDSIVAFDILSTTFQEHYAFFQGRNIDWTLLTNDQRNKLSSNSSDEELWTVLVDLIRPFDDPHVSLFNGEELIRSRDIDLEEYLAKKLKWHDMAASYMQAGELQGEDPIYWGVFENTTNSKVGYIEIGSFDSEDASFFATQSERAVNDLWEMDTIVIDLRFNLGGSDPLSFFVVSLFASETVYVGRKHAKYRNGWTDWQEVYVEPFHNDTTKVFPGNTILLTSGWTVSAAEVFTMAMKELPRTTLLGQNTIGAFSDQLQKAMPNNWRFSVSNEVYESADGEVYEIKGIPPHVRAESEFLSQADEDRGIDSWLDEALLLASETVNDVASNANGIRSFTILFVFTTALALTS